MFRQQGRPTLSSRIRANVPYHLQRMFNNGYRQMRSIVDQSRDVIFRHFGQLLLEDALQPRENDKAIPRPVVVDHSEFDFATAFF